MSSNYSASQVRNTVLFLWTAVTMLRYEGRGVNGPPAGGVKEASLAASHHYRALLHNVRQAPTERR